MSKKKLTVFLVCIAIAAISLGYVAYSVAMVYIGDAAYDAIRDDVMEPAGLTELSPAQPQITEEPKTFPEKTPETTENPEDSEPKEPFVSPIDFDKLYALNPDIYAWITIPGSDVDYPVLQHPTEDNHYLRYTVDGWLSPAGAIYTQTCNAKDFSDFNTILYGHNMADHTMFGALTYYRIPYYYDRNREIIVYTPDATLTYQVYAAVEYTDDLIPYKYDLDTQEGRQAFLDSLDCTEHGENHFSDDIEATTDDRLITLSTCTWARDRRYLVIGVLIDEQR